MSSAAHLPGLEPILEKDWQRQVIDLARMLRWRVAHFRPAMTKHGWVTPVAADGKGFPDLLLVRERLVFVELKRDGGKLTPDQIEWIGALRDACQEAYVWRPCDAEEVLATLRRRADR